MVSVANHLFLLLCDPHKYIQIHSRSINTISYQPILVFSEQTQTNECIVFGDQTQTNECIVFGDQTQTNEISLPVSHSTTNGVLNSPALKIGPRCQLTILLAFHFCCSYKC
jgi:hypothetical protein